MATQHLIIFFSSILLLSSFTTYAANFGNPIDPKSLGLDKKETLSHFKFYWQDVVGGPNATSIPIVPPVPKYNSTSFFGLVRVIDNALTIGPELNSTVVGRAEGIYASVSQSELDLLMIQSFVFYEGRYNGSTINIIGRNVAFDKVREISVVGGSGVFRFARGYVEANTVFFDAKSGSTTVEYNVYVYHH